MPGPVPRAARWILRLAATREDRDALLDDLAEEAAALTNTGGRHEARRWIRRQVLFLPYLQETAESRARAAAMKVRIDRSHYPQAIEIHTSAAVPALEQEVRRALADVDRRITVRSVISMDEGVARAFNLERLIARLTVAFGGVALLLACLGLYGVTAYSVARRTREIGLRIAVGGSWQRVVGAILRSALVQVAAGVAIGLPAALIAGRFLQARLFGVAPYDPLVLSAGLTLLACAAAIAALLPAGRAARMDPVKALRIE